MASDKPISLKDIAQKAGVSRMAVSLALRDDASIPEATRERIREIAEQLGYKANPRVARAMAEVARSRHVHPGDRIIFLTSDLTEDTWKTRHHIWNCYQGALRQAKKYGYSLDPVWALDPKLSGGKLSRMLWAQGIEGVLVPSLGPKVNSTRKLEFDWKRFSAVALDESMDSPVLQCTRHDHFNAMLLLLHSMENLGYRRIGFVMSRRLEMRTRHRWYAAYLLWRNMRRLQHELPTFIYDELNHDAARRWIREHQIDSVVGSGTSTYENLAEIDVQIPDEIGLAVLNRPDSYEGIDLAGIDQNGTLIGSAAVDMLVGMIRRGEKGAPQMPSQRVCEGQWVCGSSVKKVGDALDPQPLIEMLLPLQNG